MASLLLMLPALYDIQDSPATWVTIWALAAGVAAVLAVYVVMALWAIRDDDDGRDG